MLRQLDKLTKGNLFVEFQASFQAIKIRPGGIITLTYVKDGFDRVPLRVIKVAPSLNYQFVTILAQIQNDDWYSDSIAILNAAGRQPSSQIQIPRPLLGVVPRVEGGGVTELFDFAIEEEIQANQDGSATDTIGVSFSEPTKPTARTISLPLLSLAPEVQTSGGSLLGQQVLYYAVTGSDATGSEGTPSFIVRAQIPSGSNSNAVSITELSFPRAVQTFNVYRGVNPQSLYRIASGLTIAERFTDTGLVAEPIGLPDSSFDHANFYYRYEFAGPFTATDASRTAIACQDMGAVTRAYFNMVVRIIGGTGKGQERQISANDSTTLTVILPWTTVPDHTSQFVISESAWKFAAVSATTPAKFQIPYRAGGVLQITGRAANVLNQESSPDLSSLTRVPLGNQDPDFGVPGSPAFMLDVPGAGELTLSGVGFTDLKNVGSVTSGTLSIYFIDELSASSGYTLAVALDDNSQTLVVGHASGEMVGLNFQIGTELVYVLGVDMSAGSCTVVRGALNSRVIAHGAGEAITMVRRSVAVVPFATNFFQNRASVNYLHSLQLPDVRVVAAEFFVTNSFGDSQVQQQCFTQIATHGLRTLSGGQLSLQTNGSVTTQLNAAPPLVVQADHAVRDVRADLGRAAQGYSVAVNLLRAGLDYCKLQIAPDSVESQILDGVDLPALRKLDSLSMNISLQPIDGYQGTPIPPKDLTLTIRF